MFATLPLNNAHQRKAGLPAEQNAIQILPMKLVIVLFLALGLCVFGYFENKRRSTGQAEVAVVTNQLSDMQFTLSETQGQLARAKSDLQLATEKITQLEETKKKEVAAAQNLLEENVKKLSETGAEESKRQMTDLEDLRTKMTAMEGDLAKATAEATAAKTQLATSQAEVQRLQQLTARPPLGTVTGRK
jgi:chromosome segregation ATPase